MLGNDEFHQDEFATAPSPLSTNISGNGGEILTDKPSLTPLPSYDGTFVGQPTVSTVDDPGSDKLKTIVEHLNIGNISGNGGDFLKDPRNDDVQLMMEAHPHYTTPCDPTYYNYNSYDPPFEDNHSWCVINIEFSQQTKKPVKWISKRQLLFIGYYETKSVFMSA